MVSEPMVVEVEYPCPDCGGDLSKGCVLLCDGKPKVVKARLAPGTLSAAIQRLGWAEWEFDLANKAWRAVMAGDEEDDQDASLAAFDRLRAATDARVAALAEVRRLRPTPPEGTNGK